MSSQYSHTMFFQFHILLTSSIFFVINLRKSHHLSMFDKIFCTFWTYSQEVFAKIRIGEPINENFHESKYLVTVLQSSRAGEQFSLAPYLKCDCSRPQSDSFSFLCSDIRYSNSVWTLPRAWASATAVQHQHSRNFRNSTNAGKSRYINPEIPGALKSALKVLSSEMDQAESRLIRQA